MQSKDTSGIDSPKPEEPVMQPVSEGNLEKPAKFKKIPESKFRRIVNTITIILVSLIIGAMVILLALYLPLLSRMNKAEKELTRLAEVETRYTEMQSNYDNAIEQAMVYKTISDISLLEAALTTSDTTKANQQLRYVEEDLKDMQITDFPEILQRLQSQFQKIKSSATGNPQQALEELNKFYTDLLLLADNLE